MKYLFTLILGLMLTLVVAISCEKPTPIVVEEVVCDTEFTTENLNGVLAQAMSFLQIHAEYGYTVVKFDEDENYLVARIVFGFHNYYESKGFPVGRYMGTLDLTIDHCLNFEITNRQTWKL